MVFKVLLNQGSFRDSVVVRASSGLGLRFNIAAAFAVSMDYC